MAENAAPQWNTAAFEQFKQVVMQQFGLSEEDAVEKLQEMWGNAQQAQDEENEQIPAVNPLQDPPSPPSDKDEEENTQTTAKKTTFPDFEMNSTIPDQLPSTPLQFAINKLQKAEYIDLWYFTAEGCKEASTVTVSAADETFGLLQTDGGISLQQVKATKASRNALADEALSWDQILTARHNLINTVIELNWPAKHTKSLAGFFVNLEGQKALGVSTQALIVYQARARRKWHLALAGHGTLFDLSAINRYLLNDIRDEIRDLEHKELKNKASKISTPLKSVYEN